MMKKLLILLTATIFMVSCASSSDSNARIRNLQVSQDAKIALADNKSDEKVICKQTSRTGSHRITTVCRSESELAADREQTQRELYRKVNQTNNSVRGN